MKLLLEDPQIKGSAPYGNEFAVSGDLEIKATEFPIQEFRRTQASSSTMRLKFDEWEKVEVIKNECSIPP